MNPSTRSRTALNVFQVEKKKLANYLKLVLKLAVTSAALVFVFKRIDIREVLQVFRHSNLFLLFAALLAFVLSKLVSAFRLNRYFLATGISLPQRFNLKLYLLGMYYNLFLPGGIGGDGYKVYFLSKYRLVRTRSIFWAVMLDRVIGVLALFCLAVVFSWFAGFPSVYSAYSWILIPLSIAGAFGIYHFFFSEFKGIFLVTNAESLLVQLLQTFSALLILWSMDVRTDLPAYLFVFLVSSIVAILPITVGGVGAREMTFLLGAKWLGLDMNLSVALSFIFYLITAFTSIWGMLYSLSPRLLNAGSALESADGEAFRLNSN